MWTKDRAIEVANKTGRLHWDLAYVCGKSFVVVLFTKRETIYVLYV